MGYDRTLQDTKLSVHVHLADGSRLELRTFPESRTPFVSIELDGGAALLCSDPEVLGVLAEVARRGQAAMTVMLDEAPMLDLAATCRTEKAWDDTLTRRVAS